MSERRGDYNGKHDGCGKHMERSDSFRSVSGVLPRTIVAAVGQFSHLFSPGCTGECTVSATACRGLIRRESRS